MNQLQEALTPYLRYEMIHKVLLPVSKGEEDPLSITFCTVLQEAVKYYNILSLKVWRKSVTIWDSIIGL